jgi:hypothetical protein
MFWTQFDRIGVGPCPAAGHARTAPARAPPPGACPPPSDTARARCRLQFLRGEASPAMPPEDTAGSRGDTGGGRRRETPFGRMLPRVTSARDLGGDLFDDGRHGKPSMPAKAFRQTEVPRGDLDGVPYLAFAVGTLGRGRFHSISKMTPSLCQLKKHNPVGIIRGRLCQSEASGTIPSTLFGSHSAFPTRSAHRSARYPPTPWCPCGSVITADQLGATCGTRVPGSRWRTK